MMNQALKIILTRHSVREFTGAKISKNDLMTILKAGMAAPTAVNSQPWAFIVVTERKILDKLCESLPYAKMLDKAGAAIVVCGVPEKNLPWSKNYWVQDCSAATENILLAIHALGLGGVWTGVYPDEKKVADVRKILSISPEIIPLNVIPVGVPVKKGKVKNKFFKDNIYLEAWKE